MSRLERAMEAIRWVHANTATSLDVVLAELEELRDTADELANAIRDDIDAAS